MGEEAECMTAGHRKPPTRWRYRVSTRDWRDTVLFLGGLAGVFYETVYTKADRPTLLLLFAAMMGLPAFLRTDERKGPPPEAHDEKVDQKAGR